MPTHSSNPSPTNARKTVWRTTLLPAEHGVWAALIESTLMGLIISMTWQSIVVGFNALMLGICLQPLKLIIRGANNRFQLPRIKAAQLALSIILPLSLSLLFFCILYPSISPAYPIPLMLAIPLVLVHWYYESHDNPRHITAVTAGMLAIISITPAMILAPHSQFRFAFIVYLILAARQISSISYARYVVRKSKKLPTHLPHIIAYHTISLLLILSIPYFYPEISTNQYLFLILLYLCLCIRTVIGLTILKIKTTIKAKKLGLSELFIGIIYVILTSLTLIL